MGIYRRGRIYHIDFSDQNRRRIQESSHSTNKREAEKLLALRKSEVLRGIYHQPVRMTLGEFVVPYMEHAKANTRSWLRDEQMLKALVGFFGAERQLTDITPVDIEGHKLHRRKQVSGATVNRELALLKRMVNLAIDWDFYLGTNPVRKVKFFQEFNTGQRILTPSGEESLVRNATPYLQDIILFALNTGLRIYSSLAQRGLGERRSECLCAKDGKDPGYSNEPGNSESSRNLGERQAERIRFLRLRDRETVC
jgi:hypothetical protein